MFTNYVYKFKTRNLTFRAILEKTKPGKPRDYIKEADWTCMSPDLSRDYMFPPLEPTVLPRFWSYHGRYVYASIWYL
jgi:hypothetical protein